MEHKLLSRQEKQLLTRQEKSLLPFMNGQKLQKVVSEFSCEIDRMAKDFESMSTMSMDDIMLAECECCGLKDDCTPDYFEKVKTVHSGKWLCGLCSEAVKEKLSRAPLTQIGEAVCFQTSFCREFNSTTRLNPKLSLTNSMKGIAKRSSESRLTNSNNSSSSDANKIVRRSISCVSRIDLNNNINSDFD